MSTEEREISIIDLLYRVLLKWRFLLIWMIVGAAAMGIFGYYKYKKALSAKEAVKESVDAAAQEKDLLDTLEPEQLEKALLGDLGPEQIEKVQITAIAAKKYETLIQQQTAYLRDSILMKENPSSIPTILLRYEIDNHYQVEYPTIEVRNNIDVIRQAYMAAVVSSDIYDEFSKSLDEGIAAEYYAEVVSVSDFTNGFTIQLSHYDEESCEKMADIMKKAVDNVYADIVRACGEFDIAIVRESHQNRIDQNLASIQQGRIAQLPSLRVALTNLLAEFSEEERDYYDFLCGQVLSDSDDDEMEGESAEIEAAESSKPIQVKYILIGAIGGVFLACCWIAIRYIMDSHLHTEEDIRYFGKIQNLGTIPLTTGKKRFLHSIDCLIEKVMCGDKNALSYEESIQLAASYLEVLVSQKAYSKIFITGCRWNDQSEKIAATLKKRLENRGLSVHMMDNIILNGEAMKEASMADGVVLVEELGHTKYNELERELEICATNSLPVLGVVMGKPRIELAE